MTSTHLSRRILPRPRLLPLTIAAMSALLAVKSIVLVQAAAEETRAPGHMEAAPTDSAADIRLQAGQQPSAAGGAASAGTKGIDPAQPEQRGVIQHATPISDAEQTVLLDLRHRRQLLDARGRELDQREAEIGAADHRLGERVQQLAALQARLESLEEGRQQHSAENWVGLVKVYETMKPREAAAIFDVLDMQVLLQVLDRMQERRAAPVLAAMQPDRARLVTQLLAEMRTRSVTPVQSAPTRGGTSPIDSKS